MRKLHSCYLLSGLILFLLVPGNTFGRKYVKIATIGAPAARLDLDQEPQVLVDQVIEF
jgi:hypothetical protein